VKTLLKYWRLPVFGLLFGMSILAVIFGAALLVVTALCWIIGPMGPNAH
jgi:hypothetical protein